MSRAFPAIVLLILGIVFAFSSGAVSWGPVTPTKTFHEMQSEVAASLDLGDPYIADTAMIMAADYPGQLSINQVRQIYDTMAQGGWYYYSDPSGSESYQNANQSLQKGKIRNTIGMGDCDDFAILMTSLVQSIGGSARVAFAYDTRNQSGHAYSELYLGHNSTQAVDEIISWLKEEYKIEDLPGINHTGEEVWLNLDWGFDHSRPSHPGEPLFGEGSANAIRQVVWDIGSRKPPSMVPVIDAMESPDEWVVIEDDNGSSANITSMPGRKDMALQVSFDLQKGGWIGVSREINSEILSEVAGLNFSAFSTGGADIIEFRLMQDDGATFGVSWGMGEKDVWSQHQALYSQLQCLSSDKSSNCEDKLNIKKIARLEIRASNSDSNGNGSTSGVLLLDQIEGVMAIPVGSPWAKAEEKRKESLGINLASQSEALLSTSPDITESVLLSIESLRAYKTLSADRSLRKGLDLLPHLVEEMPHGGKVIKIAFSPDGRYIATASWDNTARIWDIGADKEIGRLNFSGHVNAVDFSPDGENVAAAAEDGTVRIWNISGRNETLKIIHKIPVNDIALSTDGRYLAYGGEDGIVGLWDILDGKEIAVMPHYDRVSSLTFSPDSRYLASASWDYTTKIWDARTSQEIWRLEDNDKVSCVAFSPDGKYVATGSWDNTARVWDMESGEEIGIVRYRGTVTDVAFSPDGSCMASTSDDGLIQLWNAEDRKVSLLVDLRSPENDLAFSPDGKYVIISSSDGTARIFDVQTGHEKARMLHDDQISSAAFSPDVKYVATAGWDGTAKLWKIDIDDSDELARIKQNDTISAVDFSPDGKYLATACWDGSTRVWEIESREEIGDPIRHGGMVNDVAFSHDGRYLASAGDDGRAVIWDLKENAARAVLNQEKIMMRGKGEEAFGDSFLSIAFNPDARYVATVGIGNTAKIWDAKSGAEEEVIDRSSTVSDAAFSPDGGNLVIAGNGGSMAIWDILKSSETSEVNFGNAQSIALSRDGRYLAATDWNNTVGIWNVFKGEEIARLPHKLTVKAIALSPNETYLATATADDTIRIWEIATSREISNLYCDDSVKCLAFSPDETRLASGTKDGTANIWHFRQEYLMNQACTCVTRNLNLEEWRQHLGDEPYRKTCPNPAGN